MAALAVLVKFQNDISDCRQAIIVKFGMHESC